MGVLTRDLTRLRNEIVALRNARHALIHDLERETGDRRTDVSSMLADFSKGLSTVVRKARTDCRGSLADLKRTVSDLRMGIRTDLGGIRETWLALGAPSRREAEEFEDRAGQGAEGVAEGSEREIPSELPPVRAKGEKRVRRKRKH